MKKLTYLVVAVYKKNDLPIQKAFVLPIGNK